MKKATNSQRTLLRKLSMKKYRLKERKFLVEGSRAVIQAIQNGLLTIDAVFCSDEDSQNELQKQLTSSPSSPGIYQIEEAEMSDIADTENTQGVIALCEMPVDPEPTELMAGDGLILATDQIQDPGNMGTLIRTASWFGIQAILAGTGSADPYHPKVVRSTAGALGTLPILPTTLDSLLHSFEKNGWQVTLLDARPGSISLDALSAHPKRILVIGNEANGIHKDLFKEQRMPIHIPGNNGMVESLNAAIAASIAIWHCSQLR